MLLELGIALVVLEYVYASFKYGIFLLFKARCGTAFQILNDKKNVKNGSNHLYSRTRGKHGEIPLNSVHK